MKTNLIFLAFTLFFLSTNAQDSFIILPQVAKINCPMILNHDHIILSKSMITSKEAIEELSVLKDKPTRETHDFYNLTANGILLITLKNNPAFKTQTELNTFYGLEKNNSVYVNGYLLEHAKYTIATESIVEVELVPPNQENGLAQKVINVWTLTKEERINGCPILPIK